MRVLRVQAYCTRAAVLLLCFASGLELPQLRASIAVATALRRHVRSCSPRAAPHSPCFACFVQVSMSAIQRGAVGLVWHMQILPRKQCLTIKFSRGAAPRTPRA